ncbi:MAG: hypothetical protein JRF63_07290 [Deltaproteobacteria bacterium]|nr:hypothetical protein [Deltaproteobacteria bacterium]
MFLSRIWTLLLALAAGVVLAVIMLATDVVNRERGENATALLFKELDKVEITLNLHARKRLDVLLAVAVDPDIRKMMAAVSANADKLEKHRQPLLTTLRQHNEELDKYTADILIAVDTRGEVVAQVGEKQRQMGYHIGDFPAVDGALRGYVRDDVWMLDKDVYLIAARPIIDQGRYVGAVVHAMKINDKLASEISPNVQLAFFVGDLILGVGTPKTNGVVRAQGAHIAGPLEQVRADKKFREKGYSDVQQIDTPDGSFMAVYAMVRGEASGNDVLFGIVTPLELMTGFTEFYEMAGTQDLEALPKVWLILGVILAALFGWAFNYLEAERPLSRLHKQITALEQADPKDQLNIYKFRRRIRKIAASINKLIDVKIKAMLEVAGSAGKNIGSILGDKPDARLSSASFKFAEPSGEDIPPPPPGQGKPGPASAPMAKPVSPKGGRQAATKAGMPVAPAPGGGPPPAPAAAAPKPLSPEEEQKYFRQIYQQFVDLKKKLGEPVDQLEFERFEVTLRKNRDTLMARYGCTQVRFQVYEKDGKASLKATPVK